MSKGYEVILVVVNKLSKYGRSIPLKHPFMAKTVTKVFIDHKIVRLHRFPCIIVIDKGGVFMNTFSKELFEI